MKKLTYICLTLLVLAMLLCACSGELKDPSSTNPSENTTTTGQAEQTLLETKEDFASYIKNTKIDGKNYYVRALGCIFDKPENIPAWFYFYLGVGENGQFTQEETTFLANAFKEKNPNSDQSFAFSAIKLPVEKINTALSVLGVTLKDIQIPDEWAYFDKTDSYYFWVTDAYGVTGWTVTKVEKGTNGIVAVYWETKEPYWGDPTREEPTNGAKMVMTMQAMPDGSYRILSNMPQEP